MFFKSVQATPEQARRALEEIKKYLDEQAFLERQLTEAEEQLLLESFEVGESATIDFVDEVMVITRRNAWAKYPLLMATNGKCSYFWSETVTWLLAKANRGIWPVPV